MAYNELIKNFTGIRNYMRQFLVYGFRSRDEFNVKSTRSYDNEKRRIESWISDCMSFRQDANGKSVFLSVDSRHIPANPLYKAWKASCFTRNDISIHFLLLDILADGKAKALSEILDCIDTDYLPAFQNALPIDESTLRKKLKEYSELGLISCEKQGKQLFYKLSEADFNLSAWQNAIAFFSEDSPLGVVGSYLMDKFDTASNFFSFKHRYLLFALDSDILLKLLSAIHQRCKVKLELADGKSGQIRRCTLLPLKIYSSVQGGRQYLAAYSIRKMKIYFSRLDSILKADILENVDNFDIYQEYLKDAQAHIWGVAAAQGRLEHIEVILTIEPQDIHIAHRLEREKRCGSVERLSDTSWSFIADVYDTWELLPWLRTFIGRIDSLSCSNRQVEKQFWDDLAALNALYGGDNHAV